MTYREMDNPSARSLGPEWQQRLRLSTSISVLTFTSAWQALFLATLPANQLHWDACTDKSINPHSLTWSHAHCTSAEVGIFVATWTWQALFIMPLCKNLPQRSWQRLCTTTCRHFLTWLGLLLPARAGLALWLMNNKVNHVPSIGLQFILLVGTVILYTTWTCRLAMLTPPRHQAIQASGTPPCKPQAWLIGLLMVAPILAPLYGNGQWDWSDNTNPHGFHLPWSLFMTGLSLFLFYLVFTAQRLCQSLHPAQFKQHYRNTPYQSALLLITSLPFSYYLGAATGFGLSQTPRALQITLGTAAGISASLIQQGLFAIVKSKASLSQVTNRQQLAPGV